MEGRARAILERDKTDLDIAAEEGAPRAHSAGEPHLHAVGVALSSDGCR